MGLIHDALFASNHFEDVIRRSDVIDGPVLGDASAEADLPLPCS